ncbi:MAG: prepilin-type N-terminal cleavage/methylation domain-containing protein [Elusimicrobium sp.]|jgi:prepilin-type N-terminal cleavage/methylation domain-containing protein|nr:prepilin-type N-terminal cleavage/methylation domain-containing protein [Elusimicrobium sp.]
MNKQKGFTLLEMLVVVFIIGILAAIAVPSYKKAVERSKATEAFEILSNIRNRQEQIQQFGRTNDKSNKSFTVNFSDLGEVISGVKSPQTDKIPQKYFTYTLASNPYYAYAQRTGTAGQPSPYNYSIVQTENYADSFLCCEGTDCDIISGFLKGCPCPDGFQQTVNGPCKPINADSCDIYKKDPDTYKCCLNWSLPGGRYWEGTQCRCPRGAELVGTKCVTPDDCADYNTNPDLYQCCKAAPAVLPDGRQWAGGTCPCPQGTVWDSNGKKCVPENNCPKDLDGICCATTDITTCDGVCSACECSMLVNGICTNGGSGGCPNATPNLCNGVCQYCPCGQTLVNGVCKDTGSGNCPQDKPYYYNNTCNVCPQATPVFSNGFCCPVNNYYTNGVCCPDGYVGNNGTCVVQPPTGKCESFKSDTAKYNCCLNGSDSYGRTWNGDDCVCPKGTVWDSKKCSACTSPNIIVDGNCCPSDKKYYWNGLCQSCPQDTPVLSNSKCCAQNTPNYCNDTKVCQYCPCGQTLVNGKCAAPEATCETAFAGQDTTIKQCRCMGSLNPVIKPVYGGPPFVTMNFANNGCCQFIKPSDPKDPALQGTVCEACASLLPADYNFKPLPL